MPSELGFGSAKRALAARLGVDPYSGNPVLRERLDKLAWAATVGKLGVDLMGFTGPLGDHYSRHCQHGQSRGA